MDRLKAYYMLSKVQPPYFRTRSPYQATHNRRIQYNVKELELHFNEVLGVYFPKPERHDDRNKKDNSSKPKRGGGEAHILMIQY